MGAEDREVLNLLVTHIISQTGIPLRETVYTREPRAGEFVHLATKDSAHKAGVMRLMLGSGLEAQRVFEALHGRSIQVGTDLVGIEVRNDVIAASTTPGNRGRSRG